MPKRNPTILATGGAGYIGSHAVRLLIGSDRQVVVVDNLFRGHREAVHPRAEFAQLDLSQTDALTDVMRDHNVSAVMHFAALAYVGESVQQPIAYYQNNTAGTLSLLQAMDAAGVKQLVFSSTCATYGVPKSLPISEETPQQPINPYGWSKLFVERILLDKAAADPEFAFTALRYFNVGGCAEDGSLGEDHKPETHLIPLVLQVAAGRRDAITVFGSDYDTPDGTCIRDYVHVDDLGRAHLLAIERLDAEQPQHYNVGIGHGYSVREVIESAERVTGRKITVIYGDRRLGDPPELWANADKIRSKLGWSPQFTVLDDLIGTAWEWMQTHANGYGNTDTAETSAD